jgi:hypothetical protein
MLRISTRCHSTLCHSLPLSATLFLCCSVLSLPICATHFHSGLHTACLPLCATLPLVSTLDPDGLLCVRVTTRSVSPFPTLANPVDTSQLLEHGAVCAGKLTCSHRLCHFVQLCATHCHSLSLCHSFPLVSTHCHSLPFISTHCHSLPLISALCHSFPLSFPLCYSLPVCATVCHSCRDSLPSVSARCLWPCPCTCVL